MEQWKEIKEYEGLYQISSYGRIKNKSGKILKFSKNKNGYLKTNLSKNGNLKTVFPHQLVAFHFLENPNNYPCVNHKDENKTNNIVDNLEFCTAKYNCNYGTALIRRAKKQSIKVAVLDCNNNLIKIFDSVRDTAKFVGCNSGIITKVCKRKNNKYKNYIIKYS